MDELDGGVIVEILNRVELTPKQLMRAMLTCQRFKEACERGPLDLRKIAISSCENADSCRDFMGLETELDVHHLPEQAVGPFASLSSLTVCLGANRGLIDVLQYFPAVTKLDLDAGV